MQRARKQEWIKRRRSEVVQLWSDVITAKNISFPLQFTALSRRLEESEKVKSALSSKAEGDAVAVDELRSQLAKADIDMEELRQVLLNC